MTACRKEEMSVFSGRVTWRKARTPTAIVSMAPAPSAQPVAALGYFPQR